MTICPSATTVRKAARSDRRCGERERQTHGKLPVNTHTHFVNESRTYDITRVRDMYKELIEHTCRQDMEREGGDETLCLMRLCV